MDFKLGGVPMENSTTLTAPMVQVEHVSSDYFIMMVREYEKKYHMDWLTFFTEHQSSAEETNEDFSDWLFLCKAYFADLVAATGPPLEKCTQKPERDSGFCYLRDTISPLAGRTVTLRGFDRPGTQQRPDVCGRRSGNRLSES
jgi:hypothetical protein